MDEFKTEIYFIRSINLHIFVQKYSASVSFSYSYTFLVIMIIITLDVDLIMLKDEI